MAYEGFFPPNLLSLVRLVKGAPATGECNKYDLTSVSFFDWSIIMIGRRCLLLVVPTYLQSLFESYRCG